MTCNREAAGFFPTHEDIFLEHDLADVFEAYFGDGVIKTIQFAQLFQLGGYGEGEDHAS